MNVDRRDIAATGTAKSPAATGPKSALDVLLTEATTADIIRRARWLDTLNRHLHACLPAPLSQHVRLGNVQGETLVYLVDSPIWHARLRLSSETILDAARGLGLHVTALRIRLAQQPFDLQLRTMAAVETRMRRNHGTSEAEGHALAELCALLATEEGSCPSSSARSI